MTLSQNAILSKECNELTPVQQFYQHKSIFITGGTGFLGKVLIEKLLWTCNPEHIFILVRSKKDQDIRARIENLLDDPLFHRLKQDQPNFRSKIIPISGDCALPELGLNQDDRSKLQHTVQIVLHVGATTRFNEEIKSALRVNVNGTKEVLFLCRQIHHLKAVVHVSTVFANSNREVIEEKLHTTKLSGEHALQLLSILDEKTFDEIAPTLIEGWPNTYTYTKCLAEDLIRSSSRGLPICVFRPAIVIPTYKEPISGWCDNMFGLMGIVVAYWIGLLSILFIKQGTNAELVPADMCVNSIITSAWEIASNNYDDPPVYNYVTSESNRITWHEYKAITSKYAIKWPLLQSVWYYRFTMISNKFIVSILQFLYHILPALIVDVGLMVIGKKTKMLQTYRRMHRVIAATEYFRNRNWIFHGRNAKSLYEKLEERDKDLFYADMSTINWEKLLACKMFGLRKYLLREDPNNIPQAIKRYQRLKYLHYLTIFIIDAIAIYILYKLAQCLILVLIE